MAQTARPSRALLRKWLEAKSERTQAALAAACGVSQQTISSILRKTDPVTPSERVRGLIEVATAGAVPAAGWLTKHRRKALEAARSRAERFSRTEART